MWIIPFPTKMFMEFDTVTVHRSNELPLIWKEEALEFPRNSSDTQPPPATAFADKAP